MTIDDEPSPSATQRVVVLYEHELLGLGLAARLRESGIPSSPVGTADIPAVTAALTTHPDIIITETMHEVCRERISTLSPTSRVVDVSKVIGRGVPATGEIIGFDAILAAIPR